MHRLGLLTFLACLAVAALPLRAEDGLPLEPERRFSYAVEEGTWMSLDVAPDGGSLLFDILGDIYRLDIRGGKAEPVLTGQPFESQPVYSPDGRWIAFISDRDGNENLWIARSDGSNARKLSDLDDNTEFTSPAWSSDGETLYVSRVRPDRGTYQLWAYDRQGDSAARVTREKRKGKPVEGRDRGRSALGAVASRDGRFLYYGIRSGGFKPHMELPAWRIVRRDMQTGQEHVEVTAQGSAMRPALSPDDRLLVYATRHDGRTGLRLRDLETGGDRWLVYPVTTDQQEAWHTLDVMPRYAFSPDGQALFFTAQNKIKRVELASGVISDVPFKAELDLQVGPSLRLEIHEETGPVRARLIQTPAISPDGRLAAFSALGKIYVMALDGSAPRRLTRSDQPEFQPSWSRDGRSLLYVTWTARDAGHIWRASLDGGEPQRLTQTAGFYSYPVELPDGDIAAMSRSHHERLIQAMDLSLVPTQQSDLVRIPAAGGRPARVASGLYAGPPQIASEQHRIFLYTSDGLASMRLDGSDRREHLKVTGAGYYFLEGRVPVDDLRVSPDGRHVLALSASQLYVIKLPKRPGKPQVLDLNRSRIPHKKITAVGADFIGWADEGRTVTWSVGSTLYRMPLASIEFDEAKDAAEEAPAVEKFRAVIELPRDIPQGALLLRGATAITMGPDGVIEDADLLVVNNRIAAVGRRGTLRLPDGIEIRDVEGRFVLPGFIDTHSHWAGIRRGILDLESYDFLANLAYGVTAGLDVSTLSIDTLVYQDLLDAGLMTGLRAYSTGPALFSYNEIETREQAVAILRRYKQHYRLDNLKQYRVGNRRQRQLVAQAAREVGLMPTTEGADNFKLAMTQMLDGYAGHEHALPAAPLGRDVIELITRARVGYTPTLVLGSGPPAFTRFVTETPLAHDPKIQRFFPKYLIDMRTQRGHWYRSDDYIYPQFAKGVAAIARAGGLIGVGSHSELEGIAFHAEMQAFATGGMTAKEILHAATIGSAEVIGRHADLGSLEPGKLADLIVLDRNPLQDIRNTLSLSLVMKNGRLYDADTMDELWPRQRELPALWFQDRAPEIEDYERK